MTEKIMREHLDLIEDRFRCASEVRMSRGKLVALVRSTRHHLDWHPVMEAIANDPTNQFHAAAKKLLLAEKLELQRELRTSRTLITLEAV